MRHMETMAILHGTVYGPPVGWSGPPGPFVLFPFLFSALFLALLVWAAFRFLPGWQEGGRRRARRDPAEEILRERFARGEITAEEYLRSAKAMRADEPRGYEEYVREAEERLGPEGPERGTGS